MAVVERIVEILNQESDSGTVLLVPHAAEMLTFPVKKIEFSPKMDFVFVLQIGGTGYSLYINRGSKNSSGSETLIITRTQGDGAELRYKRTSSPRVKFLGHLLAKNIEELTVVGNDEFLERIVQCLKDNALR